MNSLSRNSRRWSPPSARCRTCPTSSSGCPPVRRPTDLFLWSCACRPCAASLLSVRLPSLAFLQHSPRLERLTLVSCAELTAADLLGCLRTRPLLALLELHVYQCVDLSTHEQAELRPPSELLPGLQSFGFAS